MPNLVTLTDIPLARAERWAAEIAGQLRAYCARLEIAGSIRRRRPTVNDIDLVCQPRVGQRAALFARCREKAQKVLLDGRINLVVVLTSGLQIDLFIAADRDLDWFDDAPPQNRPDNFGSVLLCRTGSKGFNVWLADRARGLGLHWHPYRGIMRHDGVLAAASEADIFAALDLPFIPPERREMPIAPGLIPGASLAPNVPQSGETAARKDPDDYKP